MPRLPHPDGRAPARAGAALAAVALAATACGTIFELEPGDPVTFVQQPQTSRILAPDGTVLAELHAEQDREEVPLSEVADELTTAVVAIEDRRFFLHAGVDLAAIARAAVRNIEIGEIDQGGSTITQQYVKNTMTGPARTFDRKLEEAALAWQLEQAHGKDEILERYLNTVYFGRGAYGVAAASRRFFDREPDELDLASAALLAGVIASPSRFDPWDEPDAALERRDVVLDALLDTAQASRDDVAAARDQPLELAPLEDDRAVLAPWVVGEVRRQLQHDPDGRFTALGVSVDERADALFSGGLRIVTTVDLTAQAAADAAVEEILPADGPSAAVVVLDPATGAIRALVGGQADDAGTGFNLATQGRRQPGSAFKPIVLAAAIERGVGLDRSFPAGECVTFAGIPGWDDGVCNYGGVSYGPLTLREGTVRSANTVFARLGVELGPSAMVQAARQLGIGGDLAEVHALALGSEDVSPLELASAYSAFATLGRRAEPYVVERVETAAGEVLYEHVPDPVRVLDESVAWLVTDTLVDVVRRGTGVRATIDRPQAGKTGTSQENADAWFVGYTPDLVAAVWIGFPEARIPLQPPNVDEVVEGGRWPAEIWQQVASAALAGVPPSEFARPEVDVVTVEVDVSRNCLPNPYTPGELVEAREFLRGTEPTERCTEPTGPALDDVPALLGLPVEVAQRLLTERGFELELRSEHSRVYPPGYVTRQRPDPGDSLERDEVVVVWRTVASRTSVEVGDVLGLPVDEAVAALEADGWVVEVLTACPCSQPPGTVHGQRPGPGVPHLQHDVVTVTAVPDDPPEDPADEEP